MDETTRRSRLKAALPVRIRGMSAQNKFFDEETETQFVGTADVVIRLRSLVELETQVHLSDLKNNSGGTFRVVWVNSRPREGFHDVGLELLEAESKLWRVEFPPAPSEAPPQATLECLRCHQSLSVAVVEAEEEFLRAGFQISRHCDACKATTDWKLVTAGGADDEADALEAELLEPGGKPKAKSRPDKRNKGRARLRMVIKVIRKKYGMVLEDVIETKNVSRGGAYFISDKVYEVGEPLEVVMPYKKGEMTIPVRARVVRLDSLGDFSQRGVAIRLEGGKK